MPVPPENGQLETLLEYLRERRNFDFRGYKRASLSRRIFKRMQAVGVDDYQRYTEILEANPGEFAELFDTILINVTSLMRDPEAWQVLAERVLPAIISTKSADDPVRVWSAGCASGEEPYTLAVLLAEALGEERFRRVVKIYATDADSDALVAARHGRYPRKDLAAAFGDERASTFFEPDGDYGVFRADLRRALIFGRHDLVQDSPISRIDLVACRNTLMYFTSAAQEQILASFHFALSPGGYLFLGKSEALATRTHLFEVTDLRQHIVRKNGDHAALAPVSSAPPGRAGRAAQDGGGRPVDAAFEHSAVAQVFLDGSATLVMANRAARRLLSIGSSEFGRRFDEAQLSSRPADLRGPVERAMRERRPVTVEHVGWHGPGNEPVSLDITVAPAESPLGVVIAFLDVSRSQHLSEQLEQSRRELENAYEELQSTVEELETTNEELQSANEELETTNEELHSTNEELETMNEELQSTNEELETTNYELRDRSAEVGELNRFLEAVLSSLQSAVIVLGTEMDIRAWNRQAEELWGLRSDEVTGQHFLNLDIGFPVEVLRNAIRACLTGRSSHKMIQRPAVNRRGKPIECSVSVSSLTGSDQQPGVILTMDATPRLDVAHESADSGA